MQSWVAVTAAHACPAVAELLVLSSRGRGHQRLFPDGPSAACPGTLRPGGRPTALIVLSRSRGRSTADVPVRRRGGRRRGICRHQVFRAAGWEAERAYGRRTALVEHGLHQQAVFVGGHRVRSGPSSVVVASDLQTLETRTRD